MRIRLLILCCLGLLGSASGHARTPSQDTETAKPSLRDARSAADDASGPTDSVIRDPAELKADLASFDQVWSTIREKHWDRNFDEVAWAAERDKLRPQVGASQSRDETRKIIDGLIQSLGQSHFGVIPVDLYEDMDTLYEPDKDEAKEDREDQEKDGETGLWVRLIHDMVVVSRVAANSAAESAGVQTGWELVRVGTKSAADLLKKMREKMPATSPLRSETLIAMVVESRLKGDSGQTLEMEFLDGEGQTQELTVTLADVDGFPIRFGHLPKLVLKTQVRELAGGTGYVWFNSFFEPVHVMADIKQAIAMAKTGNGMVLDLRGNIGGLGGMTMGVGNLLVEQKKLFLGTLRTRDTELKFTLIPNARPYVGPLAILVDECSMSSAEILAGGLQAIGRGRVFGTRTAGAALPSMVEMLPNQDRFQYAFAGYENSDGRTIERNGVTPDVIVELSRDALLQGRDPVLDAALQWLQAQN